MSFFFLLFLIIFFFFFQAEDGIRDFCLSRGLGDVYKRQLQKRLSDSFEGSASYTYGHAYDVWDLTSSVAYSNWQYGRSYSGRQDAQDLNPSKWDAPHRVVLAGTYSLPSKTDISVTFFGESGVPFEYIYGSDMNGDQGYGNDLMYVPKNAHDATEIQFSQNGNLTPACRLTRSRTT